MITLLVTVTALVAVAVAAYLLGALKVTRQWLEQMENVASKLVVANDALIDRLAMKHGFMPLSEKPISPSLPIQSMELQDPYTNAQEQWEIEDDARLRSVMSREEAAEIAEEARRRGN